MSDDKNKKEVSIEEIYKMDRRCPRLGHPVSYEYCRNGTSQDEICFKILDCWWEMFDVAALLSKELPAEEFEKLVEAKPKPKVLSILEIVEKFKNKE